MMQNIDNNDVMEYIWRMEMPDYTKDQWDYLQYSFRSKTTRQEVCE